MRDYASRPYLRERAAALLKVAASIPAAVVARQGLLRPRKPETIYICPQPLAAPTVERVLRDAGLFRKLRYIRMLRW